MSKNTKQFYTADNVLIEEGMTLWFKPPVDGPFIYGCEKVSHISEDGPISAYADTLFKDKIIPCHLAYFDEEKAIEDAKPILYISALRKIFAEVGDTKREELHNLLMEGYCKTCCHVKGERCCWNCYDSVDLD